jgi:DNA-binding NarL/FixJ family response regulator
MIRVLIADDQVLVRDGFGMILDAQEDIEVVGTAGDGHEAVERARSLRPDVILMDIRMPGLDGIEATRRLSADGDGGPRVLMLTTFDQNAYVYEAMKAGASGFLLKDASATSWPTRCGSSRRATRCCRRRSPAGSSRSSPGSAGRARRPASGSTS